MTKMDNLYGWAGKILWVDLSTGQTTKVPTSEYEPEKYLGGVGLNTRIFWELGCPRVEAFHPDNPLMLSVGPLTGTGGPFTRATMCSIAPQCYPEELFTYSGFGGKFPSELKYAGYDGIIIVGKAERPVYLLVENEDVCIMDAGEMWGLETFETQKLLTAIHPQASVLTIGPAGEHLSRIAIIINETSGAAGQGGYGAVMGSKNLKAIVTRGTGTVKIGKPDEFMEFIRQRKAAGEWTANRCHKHFRYPNMLPRMDALKEEMEAKYLKKFSGCYACPYQCHGIYDIPGVGQGASMCADWWYGNNHPDQARSVWEGSLLTQWLGINNFETGAILKFLSRCIRDAGMRKEDFGLTFDPVFDPGHGDEEAHHNFLRELLGGIAYGTSPFAQGAARVADQLGHDAREIYNSISPARGYAPHWNVGVGENLHWATDTRDPFNSCHDYTEAHDGTGFGKNAEVAEWFGVPGGYLAGENANKPKQIYEGTERLTVWVQHNQSLKNSLVICEFASIPGQYFHPPDMDLRIFESKLFSLVTGIEVDADQLWRTGERIFNLRRAVMVLRENRHRDDDEVNHNFAMSLSEPLDKKRWSALQDRYYTLRGWDVQTGVPTRTRLEELGLKDVAEKLQKAGRI